MARSTGRPTPGTWRSWPRSLGMQDSKPVKTPGDKNDSDKTFRYRDLDGEGDGGSEDAATTSTSSSASTASRAGARVRVGSPASPLTRKDIRNSRGGPTPTRTTQSPTTPKPCRQAQRVADVQTSEQMGGRRERWTLAEELPDAQWVPSASRAVTRTVVRDGATGAMIHDSGDPARARRPGGQGVQEAEGCRRDRGDQPR